MKDSDAAHIAGDQQPQPENLHVLIEASDVPRIIDFGSTFKEEGWPSTFTLKYMSPEVIFKYSNALKVLRSKAKINFKKNC